jgi:hypothetical protein
MFCQASEFTPHARAVWLMFTWTIPPGRIMRARWWYLCKTCKRSICCGKSRLTIGWQLLALREGRRSQLLVQLLTRTSRNHTLCQHACQSGLLLWIDPPDSSQERSMDYRSHSVTVQEHCRKNWVLTHLADDQNSAAPPSSTTSDEAPCP